MKKYAAVLVVVAALAGAGSASADQSSAGCQAYGQLVAGAVQASIPGGAVVSSIATSEPGAVPVFAGGLKQAVCGS
jgi:hypothetical protein